MYLEHIFCSVRLCSSLLFEPNCQWEWEQGVAGTFKRAEETEESSHEKEAGSGRCRLDENLHSLSGTQVWMGQRHQANLD